MTIEVIASYYKEEFLKPLFEQHYWFADQIFYITQQRDDGKFDDEDKMNWVNGSIAGSKADWVVLVDMDEFVFPVPYGSDPREVLREAKCDMIYSQMVRVWRHYSDVDIDQNSPPVPQRLHGQMDHRKPCIFKPEGVVMGAGNHDYRNIHHIMVHGPDWSGAHWANADKCFWIERETQNRGPRLSDRNRQRGYGTHTLRTKEQILAECKAHENDPVIIKI
jgi:hypothetical protein